ncbi:SIMPL domain-containing protein [Nocardioides sp.]|uniref:SIMPL domain-containing protein n=1 Tax=Nocardioides sp. TaxID=35761 RepID=UPI002C3264D9|nr:SIMPL domain-containing protein [Nocardioides sp.]HSX67785.1 SIMPL domain-containing protein [Nocardioides sp.]
MNSPRALIGAVAILVLLLVLAVLAAYALGTQRHSKVGDQAITVSGTGKVTVVPDLLIVDLAVKVTRPSNAEALAEGNRIEKRVTAALEKAGIEKKDIRTTGFSINPHFVYDRNGEHTDGYDAEHTIRVYARDLDTAGRVLGDAVTAGGDAVQVRNTRLTLSDKGEAMDEARAKAVKDARSRAKAYAAAGGRDLGKVVRIREREASSGYVPAAAADSAALLKEAAGSVPIEPGEQKLQVDVEVVFELA